MRFNGTLKTWNDDRGFGFIEPEQGGQELFVHIKSFPAGSRRPSPGQRLSFEVEVGPQGKKRARAVQVPALPSQARPPRADRPAPWTFARLMALPMFLVFYTWVVVFWGFQPIVALVYAATSILAMLMYAFDKSAAVRGGRRTPENALHLIAIAGGWPGALLAQQVLRHKTAKRGFVHVFWGTVALNLLGLVFWHAGPGWLA